MYLVFSSIPAIGEATSVVAVAHWSDVRSLIPALGSKVYVLDVLRSNYSAWKLETKTELVGADLDEVV